MADNKGTRESKDAKVQKEVRIMEEGLLTMKTDDISPELLEDILKTQEGYDAKKSSIDAEDIQVLHSASKIALSRLLTNFILIQDNYVWRIALLSSIYNYYILSIYKVAFLKGHGDLFVIVSAIVVYTLFALNYTSLLVTHFWKKIHLLLIGEQKGWCKLILDGLLVLPYHIIYARSFGTHRVDLTFMILSLTFSFIKMYYIMEFFSEKSNQAGVEHWNYFVAKYILILFMIAHTLACTLYLLACPFDCFAHPKGWAYIFPDDLNNFRWFLYAFFCAFINFTNSGFSVILATNNWERLVIGTAMYCGFTITTIILIGALSSDKVNKFHRLSNLRIQIEAIIQHLKSVGMTNEQKDMVLSYYRLFWKKKRGVKESQEMNMLPLPLRMEIAFDINYHLLQCSLLFRDKPEPFLRTLSLNMKHEFFQPGEIIHKFDKIKTKMICVASGIIEVTSDEDYSSPIISFEKGTVLSELALILDIPSKTNVRAATYCELQVLYKVDFVQIIKLFPAIYLQLRGAILRRINHVREDANKLERQSKQQKLNLYVSQRKDYSAIKRVKKRLMGEQFEDIIPKHHQACGLYRYQPNIKKKRGRYLSMSKSFPWILSPLSSFMQIWEVIVLLDVIAIGFIYPYFISYYREFPGTTGRLTIVFEIVYYFDIYLMLTTAIERKDHWIKECKQIIMVHLRSFHFYVELIATLPIEMFFVKADPQIYYTMKINRLVKCYRIYTFFAKLEQHISINVFVVRLIKYVIYIVLINYWFGIILYSATCFKPFCNRDGWYRTHLLYDQNLRLANPCTSHPTLMSLYFGLTVLSAVGFSDIRPRTVKDYIMLMVGSILGIFSFGYCTSELSATITYQIQMKTQFQSTMFSVEKFLTDNKMDLSIKERVMKYFELQWYYNKGANLGKSDLLFNATNRIQKMVTRKERLETIWNAAFFKDADEEFVELIASGARIIIIPPGELITHEGGISRDIYIIQKGFCSKELGHDNKETLGPGKMVGIRSVLLGWPNLYRVRAITHVKLIAISDTLYNSAVSLFPLQNDLIQRSLPPMNTEILHNIQARWASSHTFVREAGLHKTKKPAKRTNFREWLIRSFKESFLHVPNFCAAQDEDYERPFDELGFLSKMRYFTLPFCLLPQGLFLKLWIGMRSASVILYALIIPYQQTQAPYVPGLDYLFILDFVAYIDLYIMMFVGYYGEHNQLIVHPVKTASNYLKGTFLIDLILCMPWELVTLLLIPEHDGGDSDFAKSLSPHWMHCKVRIIKILQAYRLPRFFIYIEKNIRISSLYFQILKFVPFIVILLNVCSAIIVKTSCKYLHITDLNPLDIRGGYAKPPGMGMKKLQEYTMFCKRDCWIERSSFQELSNPFSIYIAAFYWATTTLVGSGLGDLTAQDETHMLIMIVMMISGTFFFGYVFAYISSYTADLHSVFSIYQGMVSELKRYFQLESVPKIGRELILANASYRWNRTEGMEPNVILSNLHPALHEDAMLHLYEKTFNEIAIFKGFQLGIFRIIGKALRERYYTRGSAIYREDDVIDTIFIVHRGELEVKFISGNEEMLTTVGIGGMMGNIGSNVNSRMMSTATALTNVDILYIKSSDFYGILKKFPEIKKGVEEKIAGEPHKDFIPPTSITFTEDEDSLSEILSVSSTEVSKTSAHSMESSSEEEEEESVQAVKKEKTRILVQKELDIILLAFNPRKWFNSSILPNTRVSNSLMFLTIAFSFINSLLVTYQFAFQDFHMSIILIMIGIDVIHIWHMFLELHTAYMNRYSDYVTDFSKIRKRYFKNKKRRVLDFFANVPIPYLAFLLAIFKIDPYTTFSFAKLFSLLRIVYIRDFFNSKVTNLMVNRLVLRLTSVFVWTTIIIHGSSCIWYMYACPIFVCYEDSWAKVFYEVERTQFEVYVISVYFILEITTNTGIGDVLPKRPIEITFLILLMLVTKFLIGIFIGMAANIMSLHSTFLTKYEEKIYVLRDYLRNENVSDHQMSKMWNYVKQLWSRRYGRQIPRLIEETMSYSNQCALKFEVYGEDLKKSYLFKDLPTAFLRQISNYIKPVIFFPGNYIVQHGDSNQSMYFVHRGEVDVLTVQPNLTELIHDVLHKGEMFGQAQGLFYGIPHHFSYRAKTTVDIGVLQLKDWTEIMNFFPMAKDLIYKRAKAVYTIL